MMFFVRSVAFLHLIVYVGIMWYGWQSYKMLRRPSWKVMGIGFAIFLVYRFRQFIRQALAEYPIDTESTLVPFAASVVLLIAFRMLSGENRRIVDLMKELPESSISGAQPVEYWLTNCRVIVREEITNALKGIEEKLSGR